MKLIKKAAVFMLSLGVLAGSCIPVRAADEYTYTVRFFSGAQGKIQGKDSASYEGLHSGDRVTFNQRSVQLNDNSKYYIKGIRESGHDNNTTKNTTSFVVTGDKDYVVVYGILSNAVGYTVRYQDNDGNTLAPDENYYGNVGDEPVLAYLYIEGYMPQAYNLTAVLKQNAAENIFTFVYTPIATAPEPEENNPGGNANPGGATTTPTPTGNVTTAPAAPAAGTATPGDAAPGAAAPGDATTPDAGGTDNLVDLDNPDVPLDNTDLSGDGSEVPLSNPEVPTGNVGGDYGIATMLFNLPLAAKAGIVSLAILASAGGVWLYKSGKLKLKRKAKNG